MSARIFEPTHESAARPVARRSATGKEGGLTRRALRTGAAIGLPVVLAAGCSVESRSEPSASTAESLSTAATGAAAGHSHHAHESAVERLGALIFFDQSLSENANQSCATCHGPDVGWTGPDQADNAGGGVYEGSVAGRFGNRKPPSSAYATLAPIFDYDAATGFRGGIFWDGRATGWKLGSPAADQAQGPFLNPLEQALPNAKAVVQGVCDAPYGGLFRRVWGWSACKDSAKAFDAIARSVAAFEGSPVVNAFSSRFDAARAGHGRMTRQERLGLELFDGKAHCSRCHTSEGTAPVFTDFGYDNIGVPKNPENPFYRMDHVLIDGQPINPLGAAWIDQGLGGFILQLAASADWRTLPYVPDAVAGLSSAQLEELAAQNAGKQRVATLRNVAKRPFASFVKAYTHNAYFKTLKGLIHFYNTRDVLPRCAGEVTEAQALSDGCWPAPEVADNLNTSDVGNLMLTPAEEDALEAFLGTLSDRESGPF